MTPKEILAMVPGTGLNSKVAEEVIDHVVTKDDFLGYLEGFMDEDGSRAWGSLQPYSEDIATAKLVVEKIIQGGFEDAIYWADFGGGKNTEPEAICKAALLAIWEARAKQVSDDILQQALGNDVEDKE